MKEAASFRLGVNYWPAQTAMGWWAAFDAEQVVTDFHRIAASGLDSVRLFLRWEDFQSSPSRVDAEMLAHLVTTMDAAGLAGLSVMPTLFTGHMSGVNWIPSWALGGTSGDERFRVVSGGKTAASPIANWYTDESMLRSQALLAGEAASALSAHEALWAWDLGNENSNCCIPPDRSTAREWLLRMTHSIRTADPSAQITIGLHAEDLEEDRKLGPQQAAEACDFLTMHGYPGYSSWADGPTDERALPFLALLTRWLGGGADVLFAEFGVPTIPASNRDAVQVASANGVALIDEREAASYVGRALAALHQCGSMGAMLWCYADYVEELWQSPPFDRAVHERSFGLWRADGTAKPVVAVLQEYAARTDTPHPAPFPKWIDIDAEEYYRAPLSQLSRLYKRYCQSADVQ